MYKHALLMTLLIHALCQITMSDSMMNVKHVLLITLLIYAVSQITTSDLVIGNYVLHFGNCNGVLEVMTNQYILNSTLYL